MLSISEKDHSEQSSIKSVSRFYEQYRIGAALKRYGAYKQKGVPVATIVKYLISLIYTGKSMFQDMRSAAPLAQGFRKDAVYDFLNRVTVNWQKLLLSIACGVVGDLDKLTSQERQSAFVADDTMYLIPHAKKTELVSKVYDHAEKGKNKYK
jgi:hypothetical protein